MKTEAVLFDLIGTTAVECGNVVLDCFENAFDKMSIALYRRVLHENRGKDKLEMIRLAVKEAGEPESLVPAIYAKFKEEFAANVNRFKARDEAKEIFLFLRHGGIKVGVGTGMERELLDLVLDHLQWDRQMFDYIGAGPELPRQRPFPDMIFDMMKKTGTRIAGRVMKVGDTVADVQEGRNAGAQTVAILAGTQPDAMIMVEHPDFTIRNLDQLRQIIR